LKVTVRFFTVLREVVGKREETLELPAGKVTVGAVLKALSERQGEAFSSYVFNPQGEVKGFLQFFVNGQASGLDGEMRDGDTLAIVPPVGGG
jgi:sulfur-carrier protein